MRRAFILLSLWVLLSACADAPDRPPPAGPGTRSETPAVPPETFAPSPSETEEPETDGPTETLPRIADQTERA